jgi:integrase
MSAGAVRRVHAILSAALNYAVSWGWIDRNPADHAHPPKLGKRRAQPPQPQQVAELLNAAADTDEELGVFLWLAVTTGARRGELAALRWPSIELDRGLLRIATNYVVRGGQKQLKGTKTGEERLLSLDSLTVEVLKNLRQSRIVALAPGGLILPADAFVFSPDPLGTCPWHPDHFTHSYRVLANGLGIDEPLKNLRHFNATQLLAAGVDLRTTAGRLGHSDGGATTLRVYASWTKPVDLRAAELLSDDLSALRRQASEALRADMPVPVRRRLARVSRPVGQLMSGVEDLANYRDLAEGLRDAIRQGRLLPGDLLPTVGELAQHCGLARSTVQRAVDALKQDGAIIKNGNRWILPAGVTAISAESA